MNFADKKKAYQQMQHSAHLHFDRELLEKKNPKHPALKLIIVDKEKTQREILWALLDVATVEEIETYRKPAKKAPEELTRLLELINAPVPETNESIKESDSLVCALLNTLEEAEFELTDEQKELVSAYKELLSAAMISIYKKEGEQSLMDLDLRASTQPELAKIARLLGLDPIDFRKETLIPLLEAYRLNLPKTEDVATKELERGITITNIDDVVAENEQLKSDLEGKDLENEELQEQLDDVVAENEDLQEQLDEEKKSEHQA